MKIINRLVIIALAATSLLLTSTNRADDEHSDATITWTKHITALFPAPELFATIAGVAGGDIGEGTLNGEAFNPLVPAGEGKISFEAEYHFVGSKHSCTVRFHAVQSPDKTGVIIGIVTEGWLKGNAVTGTYAGRTCDEGVNLTCFDGTFVIKKGTKANK
jgi:hypothetical protein